MPRRALLAATLGAVYATLLLLSAGESTFVIVLAIAWFSLSIGLLFVIPLAYHAYTTWAILWVVWKTALFARAPRPWPELVLDDLLVPVATLVLLFASEYMTVAREGR